jgi:hypothetical protein
LTAIRGGPAGPDGAGGSYQNEVESDRAAWWWALGGKSGILNGFVYSQVAGTMALDWTKGAALVSERDGSAVEQNRGYLVWADSTTRTTFGAASASARKDSVVAAFVDTEDGAVGTGALATGPHLVVVPGTSGVSTPLSDAAIQTWLGRGGFVRVMDVLINPSDTKINLSNVTFDAAALRRYRNLALTIATPAWVTPTTQRYLVQNSLVEITIVLTKGTGTITASSNGNFTDSQICSGMPAALTPDISTYFPFFHNGIAIGSARLDSGGNINVTDMYPTATIAPGDICTLRAVYTVPQG